VQRCGGLEETPNFCNTENSRETGCALRAQEREGVPIALEDVLREAADAAGADTHGRWGEAIDVFAVQEGVLECWFGEQVRRFARELSQQASLTDISLLSPFSLTTALQCSNHVLTQRGHEMSPFVS
jgi:hypothetical protein